MQKPQNLQALIRARIQARQRVRSFFSQRNVSEIDAPALARFGVTDLHIDNIPAEVSGSRYYLQSSPEYFMKRLLCAGAGDIYSLAYAYRDGERGSRHRPEFTLLEWYRLGWDEIQLTREVAELVAYAGFREFPVSTLEYGAFFQKQTGLCPHGAKLAELQAYAGKVANADFSNENLSTCLDVIFSIQLEKQLPSGLVFVTHYPACQSALARLGKDSQGNLVARRFEAFLDGLEIANGYYELTDAAELRQRFQDDQSLRSLSGKKAMEIDEGLLSALESGLPECAGVAIGFDRLLMKLLGSKTIDEVMLDRFI